MKCCGVLIREPPGKPGGNNVMATPYDSIFVKVAMMCWQDVKLSDLPELQGTLFLAVCRVMYTCRAFEFSGQHVLALIVCIP
jgi:hypothetical protein